MPGCQVPCPTLTSTGVDTTQVPPWPGDGLPLIQALTLCGCFLWFAPSLFRFSPISASMGIFSLSPLCNFQVDWRFQAGSPHALRLPYPTKQLQALQLAPGACVIVQYKDGEAAVVKCAPMAKKRKR